MQALSDCLQHRASSSRALVALATPEGMMREMDPRTDPAWHPDVHHEDMQSRAACSHCTLAMCTFGGIKAREGECAWSPSSSLGSVSDLPHPGKCLGCGQVPCRREMWVQSPSPELVWYQVEAALGHLRSRLSCLNPALCVGQVQLGEIGSCCNLGELRSSS